MHLTLETLTACNCASCGEVLLGERMRRVPRRPLARICMSQWSRIPEFVARRIDGRPYCPSCLMDRVHRPIA